MNSPGFRPVFMMGPNDSKGGLSISLYFEQTDFTRLLALVKEFGLLKVYKHGQDFFITLGPQMYSARNRLQEASLSLFEAKQYFPIDAKRFLSLADLLFHDRKQAFLLASIDPDDEFLTWTMAQELKIDIEALNPEQGQRFQTWAFEEEQRKRLLFSQLRQNSNSTETELPQGFKQHTLLHEVNLIIKTTQVLRILELLSGLSMLDISYDGSNFLLQLDDIQVSVSEQFHKCTINIGNISTLTAGAAELIAKIMDLLFYDRKQQFLRFELNHPGAEQMLFQAFNAQSIAVNPINAAQAQRFQDWRSAPASTASVSLFNANQDVKKEDLALGASSR